MSLEQFVKKLSSLQRDRFVALVTEASSTDSLARAERLCHDLEEVRVKIDSVHREREAFKDRLAAIEEVISQIEAQPIVASDLAALKLWLVGLAGDTKNRLAELRPDDDLQRKRMITQERDELIARQQFAHGVAKRIASVR